MGKIKEKHLRQILNKIEKKFQAVPLRRSLRWTFIITFFSICILSGAAVLNLNRIQESILQRKEYTTDPVDGTYYRMEPFTDNEAVVYYACYAAMAGLPAVCLALGMTVSARVFYRLKLEKPLRELQYGMSKIAADDLDFTISYQGGDELGGLCMSMERMRRELSANNEKMWGLLQKRKLLNASVAHDLRTPVTVLRGYLDFLKEEAGDHDGGKKRSDYEISMAVCGMDEAVWRMEQYVGCLQDIDSLENVKVQKKTEDTGAFIEELRRDLCQIGVKKDAEENPESDIGLSMGAAEDLHPGINLGVDKKIEVFSQIAQPTLYIDKTLLFRVIENLVQNALRYAESRVSVRLKSEGGVLIICVEDDGCGFRAEELEHAADLFYTTENSGHFGIGLNICSEICEKLEGMLSIENQEKGGARVTAAVKL